MSKPTSCLLTQRHYGSVGSPALLLLHGFGASSAWWSRILDPLAQDHHVYTLDLQFREPLDVMAQELLDWTRRKHLAQASVLGHSLGALLGMHLAAGAPQLVERLILVNPAVAIPERSLWQWLCTCREAHISSHHPPTRDKWYRYLNRQTCHVVLQALRQSPIIAPLAIPSLVLWGRHDPLFPLTSAPQILQFLPSTHLLSIEGGHSLMYEFPERIAPAILRFLASDEPTGKLTEE